MTNKQILRKIMKLENLLKEEVGSSTMDLIYELVELNIELEKQCNL